MPKNLAKNIGSSIYIWQIKWLKTLVPNRFLSVCEAVRYMIETVPASAELYKCIGEGTCKNISLNLALNQDVKLKAMASARHLSQCEALRGILFLYHTGPMPVDFRRQTKHKIIEEIDSTRQLKNVMHPEMGYHAKLSFLRWRNNLCPKMP